MSEELGQKSEEIRKYHAEQTVVFSRIRELIGHPDCEQGPTVQPTGGNRRPSFRQSDYSHPREILTDDNNLFADIQKVVPRGGTPRRVLY